jgi:peptide subunit release factor 1 (eRF1)
MDAHASDHTLLEALLEWNREAERIQERNLVEGIITGSQKGQNAVAGLDTTLWALNRNELHLLILSGEFDRDGQHCANCDILLPMDHMLCPQCDQKLTRIDLREELTGYALRKGVELEVVHGDGAELLRAYDSIGGTLRITRH